MSDKLSIDAFMPTTLEEAQQQIIRLRDSIRESEKVKEKKYEEMRCGGCGSSTVRLIAVEFDSLIGYKSIRITCCGCGAKTELSPSRPRIEPHWVDGSDGQHTVF